MRLVLLVLVLGSICLYLNAQTTAHRELSDVSIMSFTIRKYQSSDAIQLDNFSRDLSERRSSPKGKKFVVVSLVGQLEGLRKRYEFVLKDDETAKEAVRAFMIQGAIGAELL
jgi:hypothetical protein